MKSFNSYMSTIISKAEHGRTISFDLFNKYMNVYHLFISVQRDTFFVESIFNILISSQRLKLPSVVIDTKNNNTMKAFEKNFIKIIHSMGDVYIFMMSVKLDNGDTHQNLIIVDSTHSKNMYVYKIDPAGITENSNRVDSFMQKYAEKYKKNNVLKKFIYKGDLVNLIQCNKILTIQRISQGTRYCVSSVLFIVYMMMRKNKNITILNNDSISNIKRFNSIPDDSLQYIYVHFTQEILFLFFKNNPTKLKNFTNLPAIKFFKPNSNRCTLDSHWGKRVATYFTTNLKNKSYNFLINNANNLIKKVYNDGEKLLLN